MRLAYKAMRVLLYLAMAASGFLNLLTAAGLFLRNNKVGFAWLLTITIIVGFTLVIAASVKRRWLLSGFFGLACTLSIITGYIVFVHKMTVLFYTGHLHILFVPLFAFLTALFYSKLHRSRKKREEERPLRKDEHIVDGQA